MKFSNENLVNNSQNSNVHSSFGFLTFLESEPYDWSAKKNYLKGEMGMLSLLTKKH